MAADSGFNLSTITIGVAPQTPLRSITYEQSGAEVKVSGSGDLKALFVVGQIVETITFEIVGGSTIVVGAAAAIVTIAWHDGTSDEFTTGVCIAKSTSGSEDGEILTSLTFKRASVA